MNKNAITKKYIFSNDFKIILVGVACLFVIIIYYSIDIVDQLDIQKQSNSKVLYFKEQIDNIPKSSKNANHVNNITSLNDTLTVNTNADFKLNIVASYYNLTLNKSDNNYVLSGVIFDVVSAIEQIVLFNINNNLDIGFVALDVNLEQAKLLLLIN